MGRKNDFLIRELRASVTRYQTDEREARDHLARTIKKRAAYKTAGKRWPSGQRSARDWERLIVAGADRKRAADRLLRAAVGGKPLGPDDDPDLIADAVEVLERIESSGRFAGSSARLSSGLNAMLFGRAEKRAAQLKKAEADGRTLAAEAAAWIDKLNGKGGA